MHNQLKKKSFIGLNYANYLFKDGFTMYKYKLGPDAISFYTYVDEMLK